MSKIALQNALPRRSLYVQADAKPVGFTRAVPAAEPAASGTASLVPAQAAAAVPAAPGTYAERIERIGLSIADAAKLLGVSRQASHKWAKDDGAAQQLVHVALALIEHAGLEAARVVISGLDGPAA